MIGSVFAVAFIVLMFGFAVFAGNILDAIFEWICNLFALSAKGADEVSPFVVSEYFARIEKAGLDILDQRKPIDRVIILWWGLDGLRLNEDGSPEWISRKKPEPINQGVLYQPQQSVSHRFMTISPSAFAGCVNTAVVYDSAVCQSTQATIDALQAQMTQLQIENAITTQRQYLLSQIQNCCCNGLIQ